MRKNQGVTIAALIIAIVGLSIGFAAFSNTLTIRSSATVTPDESNFQVKFSKVSNADQTGTSYPITPIIPQGSDATGDNGIISESNPLTLTGLKANFTSPGEYVSYKLYVRNTGHYTAYLTNLDFKDIIGGEDFIECSGNDVSTSLRTAACYDISVSVTIGGTDGVNGDTYTSRDQSLTNEISQVSLAPGASTEVYVRISYADNGHYVDGNMTVNFGYIMLQYRSVDTPSSIPAPVAPAKCTYIDNDTSGTITVGDKVSCPLGEKTDSFYVIEDLGQGSTVKMLAEWNLNVSEEGNSNSVLYSSSTAGYQDEHVRGSFTYDGTPDQSITPYLKEVSGSYYPYGTVVFDSNGAGTGDWDTTHGYWTTGENHDLDTTTYSDCSGYPCYVYDSNPSISTFVNDYVAIVNSAISGASATGKLISVDELEALGCAFSSYTCSSAPSWVYQTSYWSGSTPFDGFMGAVKNDSGLDASLYDSVGNLFGVRPVIEISSSVIELAS